jgi:hypothetical protein
MFRRILPAENLWIIAGDADPDVPLRRRLGGADRIRPQSHGSLGGNLSLCLPVGSHLPRQREVGVVVLFELPLSGELDAVGRLRGSQSGMFRRILLSENPGIWTPHPVSLTLRRLLPGEKARNEAQACTNKS